MRRYQESPWPVRLWRRRHLVPVPFLAARWWLGAKFRTWDRWHPWVGSWDFCWRLASSEAHFWMGWWYTSEEVLEGLESKP